MLCSLGAIVKSAVAWNAVAVVSTLKLPENRVMPLRVILQGKALMPLGKFEKSNLKTTFGLVVRSGFCLKNILALGPVSPNVPNCKCVVVSVQKLLSVV